MALTQRPRVQRKPRRPEPADGSETQPLVTLPGEPKLPGEVEMPRVVDAPLRVGPPGAPEPPAPAEAGVGLAGLDVGGARLLASDTRVALLLMNYARLRAVARLFGVGPEQANLVTAVALLTLAEAARRKVRSMMEGPALPSIEDGLLGGALLREALGGVAGLSGRDTPQPATLLTLAVVGGLAGPTVIRSIRGAKTATHRTTVGFHHRYGYLVDPGHWRARHAERASRLAADRAQRIP